LLKLYPIVRLYQSHDDECIEGASIVMWYCCYYCCCLFRKPRGLVSFPPTGRIFFQEEQFSFSIWSFRYSVLIDDRLFIYFFKNFVCKIISTTSLANIWIEEKEKNRPRPILLLEFCLPAHLLLSFLLVFQYPFFVNDTKIVFPRLWYRCIKETLHRK
jgi:hypothetical protein